VSKTGGCQKTGDFITFKVQADAALSQDFLGASATG
jgi:hypothetical protein